MTLGHLRERIGRRPLPRIQLVANLCVACTSANLVPHLHLADHAELDSLIPTTDRFGSAFADLVRCLGTGEEPELSSHKAIRTTEVIFATYESSRRRGRVDLPLKAEDSALLSMLEAGEIGRPV